jgi:hypothetical protein
MVEDRGGKFRVAGMNASGSESVSDEDTCPRTFEKFLHLEGNQRFILNHKSTKHPSSRSCICASPRCAETRLDNTRG